MKCQGALAGASALTLEGTALKNPPFYPLSLRVPLSAYISHHTWYKLYHSFDFALWAHSVRAKKMTFDPSTTLLSDHIILYCAVWISAEGC